MTDRVYAPSSNPHPIPVQDILPWLLLGTVLAFAALYFVGTEQGATSLIPGQWIHEFVHDGRHALGYPCH